MAGPRGSKRCCESTAPKHVRPSSLSAARDAGTSTPRSMSRRYATLPSLMTGRGGVHEVASERLAAVPADELEGIAHPVLFARTTPPTPPTPPTVTTATTATTVSPRTTSNPTSSIPSITPRWRTPTPRDPSTCYACVRGWRAGSSKTSYRAPRQTPAGDTTRWSDSSTVPRAASWCPTSEDTRARTIYSSRTLGATPPTRTRTGTGTTGRTTGTWDATAPPPPPPTTSKGWGLLSTAACAAHERVRDENRGERAITLEDLYGWLNANEGGDFNKLHEHGGADSWSGVFYLRCPPPAKPPSSDSDSDSDSDSENAYGVGTLGLRCHEPAGSTSEAAVPYLRYAPPRAGDLLLFRGDVLHAVESNGGRGEAQGGGEGRGHADRAAVRGVQRR